MVSWSETEIQVLINLVQEREALYDGSNEDYTNREIVWALWTDIAGQLNKTPTACRDKWTSLRCIYRRIVNQQATSKKKRKVKWPWANMMTFLIPHLKTIHQRYEVDDTESVVMINEYKPYSTNGNSFMTLNSLSGEFELDDALANSEEGVPEYLYYESGDDSELTEEQLVNQPSLKQVKLEGSSQAKQLSKTAKSKHSANYSAESAEDCVDDVSSRTYYPMPNTTSLSVPVTNHCDPLAGVDADEMFFRSIIPDVKLLSRRDKSKFKIKVIQLLDDMLYMPKEDNTDNKQEDS